MAGKLNGKTGWVVAGCSLIALILTLTTAGFSAGGVRWEVKKNTETMPKIESQITNLRIRTSVLEHAIPEIEKGIAEIRKDQKEMLRRMPR